MSVYRVKVSQDEKLRMKCESEKHKLMVDEPIEVGGTDLAMNPLETLLSAFGACKCVYAWSLAERLGIKLHDITFELEGETGRYERVNNITPTGFKKIHSHITVKADNTAEEIENFIREIETRCPVRNTLIHAIPCTSDFELVK